MHCAVKKVELSCVAKGKLDSHFSASQKLSSREALGTNELTNEPTNKHARSQYHQTQVRKRSDTVWVENVNMYMIMQYCSTAELSNSCVLPPGELEWLNVLYLRCLCCFDGISGDHNGLFNDQSTVLIGASSSTGADLRPFRGFISGKPDCLCIISSLCRAVAAAYSSRAVVQLT